MVELQEHARGLFLLSVPSAPHYGNYAFPIAQQCRPALPGQRTVRRLGLFNICSLVHLHGNNNSTTWRRHECASVRPVELFNRSACIDHTA